MDGNMGWNGRHGKYGYVLSVLVGNGGGVLHC